MMKSTLRVFLAAFAGVFLATAIGQLTSSKVQKSDEIIHKSRQLDLLNHLVPLVLTKDQINKLLVVLEKCRANVDKIKQLEATDMFKYEGKINEAISKGINQDLVPSKDLLKELSRLYNGFTIRRQVAANENADLVVEVVQKEFNAGQIKAAANSLDIKVYEPKIDEKTLTEEYKLRYFIKDVILDPQGYDLLLKMSKVAK